VNARPGAGERLAEAILRRQRAESMSALRKLARQPERPPAPPPVPSDEERCEVCGRGIPDEHRHLLDLEARQINCVCDTCWALQSGEARFIPVGNRTLWLEKFELPEHIWATFRIPIGLAFFMHSSVTDCVIAMYPSPAGATESELHFSNWNALVALNPVLEGLEPDAEALIVNRLADPPAYVIAPIDRCYLLVGLVKMSWQGISGGPLVAERVQGFFDDLHAAAAPA
jgi:Family of unknown function (DUF5947)